MLGYAAYAFVRSFVGLLLISTTIIALSSITFSQLFAYARERINRSDIPKSDAPLYMNVFRLSYAVAWTIGPAAASWVLVLQGYRGIFLTTAGLFVVLGIIVARSIPSEPPPGGHHSAARTPLRHTLRRPDLLAFFLGFIVINAASTMGGMNLPLLVVNTLGGNEHQVGIIFSLAPIFEIPLMFYFGLLASRGDQTSVIRLGAILSIVYFGLLSIVQAPWHIYPLQLLAAAITAINSGLAITFFQNHLPDQPGTATNLFMTVVRVGSTAGYMLFGGLATAFGHRVVFGVCSALAAVTLLLFLQHRSSTPAEAAPATPENSR